MMASHRWLLAVLIVAIVLLLRIRDGVRIPNIQSNDGVRVVYRGDLRSPLQVQKLGGFFPPKDSESLRRELSGLEAEHQCSLFFHHTGATAKFTKYVSTTTNPVYARRNAEIFHMSMQEQAGYGHVYRIRADAKMIDVVKSLGEEHMHPTYVLQAEHAVVGGIPWGQVEGWYKMREFDETQAERLMKGEDVDELFHRNPDFNSKYLSTRGSGAQPQLAGFTERNSVGRRARNKSPWREFSQDRVRDKLEEFRLRVAPHVASEQTDAVIEPLPVFVWADALGARDLIGALDLEELEEGITVEVGPETGNEEQVPLSGHLAAIEAAESAQIEAILESRAGNWTSRRSVWSEIRPWLRTLK